VARATAAFLFELQKQRDQFGFEVAVLSQDILFFGRIFHEVV
jgi:hypothetical protein